MKIGNFLKRIKVLKFAQIHIVKSWGKKREYEISLILDLKNTLYPFLGHIIEKRCIEHLKFFNLLKE